MPQYTAAQLRNAWKPTMSRLGFRIHHSRFVTSYGPIYHSVVFQRLQRSRSRPVTQGTQFTLLSHRSLWGAKASGDGGVVERPDASAGEYKTAAVRQCNGPDNYANEGHGGSPLDEQILPQIAFAGWRHRDAIRTRNWVLVEVDGPFVGQHSPRSRV